MPRLFHYFTFSRFISLRKVLLIIVLFALRSTERNVEGHPAAKAADERISLKSGTFRLPLKKGRNQIAIALDDNLPGNTQHYGWGVELKLEDSDGVSLQSKQ